jgi:serine protease Do
MSADGYIITNEHVIDGASTIQVVTADSQKFDAKLVGADLRTDLAVLKVDAANLKPATFGDSSKTNVAEPVLAIGNPGGIEFSGSVTEGIISALDRDVTTESGYTIKCLQTDAAINPGNSGGALVNMEGQVIGITSSKIVASGFEGMGFAIPISTAQPVVNDIIANGYVTGRVKLGISVSEFSADRASTLGYPAGLLVQAVDSSSDAAAKGIQQNDIITKVNGTAVKNYDEFYQVESQFKAGDSITMTVFRYSTGKTFDVSVTLAEDKGTPVSPSQQDQQQYGQNPFSGQNPFGFSFGYGS